MEHHFRIVYFSGTGGTKPVYDWARTLPRLDEADAVILSVSGGREKTRLS